MAEQVDPVFDFDRISGLPDPIISHILSFLPTKEAIRTSVLSPRWRYLSASLSILDFSKDLLRSMTMENRKNFMNFLDRLLLSPNPITLDCFRLNNLLLHHNGGLLSIYGESILYRWIYFILSRGVKELDLSTLVSQRLLSRILTCHSLVTLKLHTFVDIHVTTNVSLPNLKFLQLYGFRLSDDSVFRFINSCLMLEELDLMPELTELGEIIIRNSSLKRLRLRLTLKCVRVSDTLVEINAPNVVFFEYVDDLAERYVLSNMKSLEKAHIKIYFGQRQDPTYFLRAICNIQSLQSLHVNVDMTKLLFYAIRDPAVAFNNLVELHLENPSADCLVEFLHCVPNLKTLILSRTFSGEEFGPEKVPSCLSLHLKEITFSNFIGGNEKVFEIISYFMNHALVLEKLRVTIDDRYINIEPSIRQKLLRLAESRAIDVSWSNEPDISY